MMSFHVDALRIAAICGLLLAVGFEEARAQAPSSTTWRGYMAGPGVTDPEAAFDVWFDIEQDGPQAVGRLRWQAGEFPMQRLAVMEERVTFLWVFSGVVMECQLERVRPGYYKGGCIDQNDEVGPMLMARPGLLPKASDLDERAALAVFGMQPLETETGPRRTRFEMEEEARKRAVPEGRRMTVDGTNLHVYARGAGAATVVFESGMGDGLRVWKDVLDSTATFARVVAYDRPGLDYSDPVGEPQTLDDHVERLAALLAAAAAPAPYILVGHDTGGFIVRRFAARYPDRVAALVLIHPAHEQQRRLWSQLAPDEAARDFARRDAFYGALPEAVANEYALFSEIQREGSFEAELPDVPVVVLTGMRTPERARWIAERVDARAVLNGLHVGLANASAGGEHRAVADAGPYLQNEKPDLLLTVLRDLVGSSRAGQ